MVWNSEEGGLEFEGRWFGDRRKVDTRCVYKLTLILRKNELQT